MSQAEFEELFCRFYPQVAAYATAILDNKTAGEDIAQEVFMYVWDRRRELHPGEGFQGYLFRMVYSRSVDYIKKNKQLEKYTKETLFKYAEEYRSHLDDDCQPLQVLFSKDFEEKLNELLDQLPEARRAVFKLVYLEGLKAKQVAEQLQMPQRTVESHIYLTMKYLRERLSPYDFLVLTFLCSFF